jgi:hypothetical protein
MPAVPRSAALAALVSSMDRAMVIQATSRAMLNRASRRVHQFSLLLAKWVREYPERTSQFFAYIACMQAL